MGFSMIRTVNLDFLRSFFTDSSALSSTRYGEKCIKKIFWQKNGKYKTRTVHDLTASQKATFESERARTPAGYIKVPGGEEGKVFRITRNVLHTSKINLLIHSKSFRKRIIKLIELRPIFLLSKG
jgi:hypothetical protein